MHQKQKVIPGKTGNGNVAGDSQKKQERSRKDTGSSLLEAKNKELVNRRGNARATRRESMGSIKSGKRLVIELFNRSDPRDR